MKTLDEHNQERWAEHDAARKMGEPHPNGIACPECNTELWDSSPLRVLTSNPPKKNIHCPGCKYSGYRLA